jgi:hypothetical protein
VAPRRERSLPPSRRSFQLAERSFRRWNGSLRSLNPLDSALDPVGSAPDPLNSAPDPLGSAPDPLEFAPDPVEIAPNPLGFALDPLDSALDPLHPADEITRFSAGTALFTTGTGPTGARMERSGCRKAGCDRRNGSIPEWKRWVLPGKWRFQGWPLGRSGLDCLCTTDLSFEAAYKPSHKSSCRGGSGREGGGATRPGRARPPRKGRVEPPRRRPDPPLREARDL